MKNHTTRIQWDYVLKVSEGFARLKKQSGFTYCLIDGKKFYPGQWFGDVKIIEVSPGLAKGVLVEK